MTRWPMSGLRKTFATKSSFKKWVPEGVRRWKEYVLGTVDRIDKTPQWAGTYLRRAGRDD